MTLRTTETTVTFRRPFTLAAFDGEPQPAGTYRLEIDEEKVANLSFDVYQRTATLLHTPALSVAGGNHQVFRINSAELTAALEADAGA